MPRPRIWLAAASVRAHVRRGWIRRRVPRPRGGTRGPQTPTGVAAAADRGECVPLRGGEHDGPHRVPGDAVRRGWVHAALSRHRGGVRSASEPRWGARRPARRGGPRLAAVEHRNTLVCGGHDGNAYRVVEGFDPGDELARALPLRRPRQLLGLCAKGPVFKGGPRKETVRTTRCTRARGQAEGGADVHAEVRLGVCCARDGADVLTTRAYGRGSRSQHRSNHLSDDAADDRRRERGRAYLVDTTRPSTVRAGMARARRMSRAVQAFAANAGVALVVRRLGRAAARASGGSRRLPPPRISTPASTKGVVARLDARGGGRERGRARRPTRPPPRAALSVPVYSLATAPDATGETAGDPPSPSMNITTYCCPVTIKPTCRGGGRRATPTPPRRATCSPRGRACSRYCASSTPSSCPPRQEQRARRG